MPNNDFAQRKAAIIKAWQDRQKALKAAGVSKEKRDNLGKLISSIARANSHGDYNRDLTDYHKGELE